jgi:L-cysteine/cystine lyase
MGMGEQLRAAMPALANKTYFNYGGQGPLPDPSLQAILSCWQSIQDLGPFTTAVWPLVNATAGFHRERHLRLRAAPVGPALAAGRSPVAQ